PPNNKNNNNNNNNKKSFLYISFVYLKLYSQQKLSHTWLYIFYIFFRVFSRCLALVVENLIFFFIFFYLR
ncbi:unnamed protein product, partial [Diamesa hyperborea]